MTSKYLPEISKETWDDLVQQNKLDELRDLMIQPLHEEMYKRKSFDFMDELSEEQQMMLAYDYVLSQVLQGGFIQFIQNHYISLLLPVIQGLKKVEADDMVQVLDDVLKVYVLNREALDKETDPKEFAGLYQEFKEFDALEEKFRSLNEETIKKMNNYAIAHPEAFVQFS